MPVIKTAILALALSLLAVATRAQPAAQALPQQSKSDAFVAQLASLFNAQLRDADGVQQQLAACQQAAATKPAPAPSGDLHGAVPGQAGSETPRP